MAPSEAVIPASVAAMVRRIDTLLLLALPASGKSELRRYLASLDDDVALRDFGLGPRVDLDDYPYVHLMRRIDGELGDMGERRVFYDGDDLPFRDGRDWATLIRLLSEDFAALGSDESVPTEPTQWLLDRLASARGEAGIHPSLPDWRPATIAKLATRLDNEVSEFAQERSASLPRHVADRSTVVVEFARGGPAGATVPLRPPHGYGFSLPAMDAELLRRACALYVWVTPEESRRRNRARAIPGRKGDASILHHGVPERVMIDDYGSDDFLWLLDQGGGASLQLIVEGESIEVPAAVFDNRIDRTSFLRADASDWDPVAVAELHRHLIEAFRRLG